MSEKATSTEAQAESLLMTGYLTWDRPRLIFLREGKIEAEIAEDRRRRAILPRFIPWLTEQDFSLMVGYVGSLSPRVIRTDITGLVVELTVRSNSKLTIWTADFDFNDHENPSGKYWIRTENDQSPVPKWFADTLAEQMVQRLTQGQLRFG